MLSWGSTSLGMPCGSGTPTCHWKGGVVHPRKHSQVQGEGSRVPWFGQGCDTFQLVYLVQSGKYLAWNDNHFAIQVSCACSSEMLSGWCETLSFCCCCCCDLSLCRDTRLAASIRDWPRLPGVLEHPCSAALGQDISQGWGEHLRAERQQRGLPAAPGHT